ncbi:glycosyltransferase family 9 protein [Ponticaulis sp.]|uniref:glycosyltransferase family 9 protein n=1 Tax=Ponticaulis sp. TaxID=2020902 RepID=UPI000C573658|nr:glycosyltransferase family 9 protein [Ponticaulis sp.]MAJ10728.1 transposase [Ponticaulis sp.]HBH90742.1 transposase [Hyphomonadaceae bacterium]HBJ94139.1 transposase [Hyphomonadaceae bacterium]|tara:strand:+ start:3044 stop:4057 length:1014 start_codon:yes stop_codon:yes gene_type:complete
MAKVIENPGESATKVLIIKLSALGDFVLAMGAMRAIRDHHPSAQITLLTTPPFEQFAKACPYFDRVETDGRPKDTSSTTRMLRRLRAEKYDIVYDLQNSGRTSNYYQALRPRPPLWSGVSKGCQFPHNTPYRNEMHSIERLAEQISIAGVGPAGGYEFGDVPMEDFEWLESTLGNPPRLQPAYFSLRGPYALLIPGSSAHRVAKRWPEENYLEIAKWLSEAGITPVVIGGKAESEIGNMVARGVPGAKSLCTRTDLFQVAALGRHATLAIGNDTGPMHMVTLAGSPGVALFATSESSPDLARPRGSNVIVVESDILENVSLNDVKQAILGLDVLPKT